MSMRLCFFWIVHICSLFLRTSLATTLSADKEQSGHPSPLGFDLRAPFSSTFNHRKHLSETLRQASLPHQHIVDCIIQLISLRLLPHPRRLLLDEQTIDIRFSASHDHTRRRTFFFNRTCSRTLLSSADATTFDATTFDATTFYLCAAPDSLWALFTNAHCFGRTLIPAAQYDSIHGLDGLLGASGTFPLHPYHRHGNEMTGGFGAVRSLAGGLSGRTGFLQQPAGGVF